jgi:hypothetical protein
MMTIMMMMERKIVAVLVPRKMKKRTNGREFN